MTEIRLSRPSSGEPLKTAGPGARPPAQAPVRLALAPAVRAAASQPLTTPLIFLVYSVVSKQR